jgi:hypothetical protein
MHSQSISLDEFPAKEFSLGLDYSRPFFDLRPSLSLLTGGYNISLHIPSARSFNFVVRLPFAVLGGKDTHEAGTCAGNIYLGVQTRIQGSIQKGTSVSAGVSIPTAPSGRLHVKSVGLCTDTLHFYRYTPNLLAIKINVAIHSREHLNRFHAFHLGAVVTLPTGAGKGDMELWGRYGVGAGAWTGDTILSAELLGIVHLSENIEKFSHRFTHSLILAATYDRFTIKPSLFIRLYFDRDLNQTLDAVAGLKITFRFH